MSNEEPSTPVLPNLNPEAEESKKCFLFSSSFYYVFNFHIKNRLGNDAFQAKKYEEAIQHYSKSIQVDPNNAVYYSNRR
jgi:tetratricopeptide (TPR) repeat protein